ncbi:unnamed protein product, partial [Brassica oleracea var. botrytis]
CYLHALSLLTSLAVQIRYTIFIRESMIGDGKSL